MELAVLGVILAWVICPPKVLLWLEECWTFVNQQLYYTHGTRDQGSAPLESCGLRAGRDGSLREDQGACTYRGCGRWEIIKSAKFTDICFIIEPLEGFLFFSLSMLLMFKTQQSRAALLEEIGSYQDTLVGGGICRHNLKTARPICPTNTRLRCDIFWILSSYLSGFL